ncbi:hypothetical protein BHE74_00048482 [Ensete ventricosum]|nr:hypothetical protein GW17_00055756 [Ensete ventricosum]RWW45659.1 hypothetical protein BHE74_00048482 [Ensete ventricosum]RZR93898.1 hypothetical protein BHM03_00022486 [Ensete ventricosum]
MSGNHREERASGSKLSLLGKEENLERRGVKHRVRALAIGSLVKGEVGEQRSSRAWYEEKWREAIVAAHTPLAVASNSPC